MIRTIINILLVGTLGFNSWSCSKASGQGHLRIVMTGNVHGQLDPCG